MENLHKIHTPSATGATDGTLELPSGAIAKVVKFSGKHVLEVIDRSMKDKAAIAEDDLTFHLIALTATVNDKPITSMDMEEMPGGDCLFLMGEFAKSVNYDASQDDLPLDPPDGFYYKRLPNNQLAMIAKFKGRHIKEAQRQMKKDGSDFFIVLISRLVKIQLVVDDAYLAMNPTTESKPGDHVWGDLFPDDIELMDGLNVFALFGEVSAAMFPQK